MATIQHLKSSLIDKISSINDKKFLEELERLIESSDIDLGMIELSEEQKLMLAMSDEDLMANRVISNQVLKSRTEKWLKEQS